MKYILTTEDDVLKFDNESAAIFAFGTAVLRRAKQLNAAHINVMPITNEIIPEFDEAFPDFTGEKVGIHGGVGPVFVGTLVGLSWERWCEVGAKSRENNAEKVVH